MRRGLGYRRYKLDDGRKSFHRKAYFCAKRNIPLSHPTVAVVILNYNGKEYLERFLPSVIRSTYPHLEVVVADNRSTDDSVSFLRTRYPDVRILENPANEGFAKGYNTALAQISADISVLLNSDVEVEPGWIEPVAALMAADGRIAACQPKILDWNAPDRFEYAGASGGWIDSLGYPFSRGRVFDTCESDTGQYDDTAPVFWATGAAMFVRTAVFLAHGGFDPYFFAHQEEIDLCWRMQLSGYRIFACPASVVRHVGGGTLPQSHPRKTFLNFRNNHIMLWKNLPMWVRLWKTPIRFALDAVSAWKSLLTGNPGYFLAIAKAHAAFLAWLLRHRGQALMPIRRDGRLEGLYRGNLIWDYFVRHRRTFAEIVGRRG
jgi:GT2 family glycosyltransferase